MSKTPPVSPNYYVLPLRDVIVFPTMVHTLYVGRPKSMAAVDASMAEKKPILLLAQQQAQQNDPSPQDLYPVGVLANIIQVVRLNDATLQVLVEGLARHKVKNFLSLSQEGPWQASSKPLMFTHHRPEPTGLRKHVREKFIEYCTQQQKESESLAQRLLDIGDVNIYADTIADQIDIALEQRQLLLEMPDPVMRLEHLKTILEAEIALQTLDGQIRERVRQQMARSQKEYYLQEQLKAIAQELGDDNAQELDQLAQQIETRPLPTAVAARAKRELNRLRTLSANTAEAAVNRQYLDWLLRLPWGVINLEQQSLQTAKSLLDHAHFGLTDAKQRIAEYLAVRQLTKQHYGPRLCFVGPPGTGKTSLAASIAKALDLAFVRKPLGGVRDEADIRGHRRTYVGAYPGHIVQGLVKAKSMNPVFLLDEIDKMVDDFRGDSAHALLEVLDPEQNEHFVDHYLDLELDLRSVFFIATANRVDHLPKPLLDRLEIIELASYSQEEKLDIAIKHLLPKQLAYHGLPAKHLNLTAPVIKKIINDYTREPGVRELERQLGKICRKAAFTAVETGNHHTLSSTITVTKKILPTWLGQEKFHHHTRQASNIGVAMALAWTPLGGHLLPVETTCLPGNGKLELTGQLGQVMQESAKTALSYLRQHAPFFGLPTDFHQHCDLHIHLPEGAIAKDGPSAGLSLAVSILSALCRFPIQPNLALTGEITLQGHVLAIGGLREKLLAAKRFGITSVIVPKENKAHVSALPRAVYQGLTLHFIDDVLTALKQALIFPAERRFTNDNLPSNQPQPWQKSTTPRPQPETQPRH